MNTRRGAFQKGQSGNPAGRPKGSRDRRSIALDSILEGQAAALTSKAVELALGGDTVALRLCLDRIAPARKDRFLQFDLPTIETATDAVKANAAVVAAVAAGDLTPSEAAELTKLIENVTRSIETAEIVGAFAERLAKLEAAPR